MPLSRRQFLQLTGIAVLGPAIGLPQLPSLAPTYGRALQAVPVYPRPDHSAAIIRHLWPDTVLPITALPGAWYRISKGYIEKAHVQPIIMPDSNPALPIRQPPFWAEVSAPVAAVREWCAADAPRIARIGHGGVMQIIDQLPGDPRWYGVVDEHGNLLGWTQASGWQPVSLSQAHTLLEIQINRQEQQMRVTSDGMPLVWGAISTGQPLASGIYPVERGAAGMRQGDYYGASWPLHFGNGNLITGVYWHNQFGMPVPGPAVQIPVYLARWLYNVCADSSHVAVF